MTVLYDTHIYVTQDFLENFHYGRPRFNIIITIYYIVYIGISSQKFGEALSQFDWKVW